MNFSAKPLPSIAHWSTLENEATFASQSVSGANQASSSSSGLIDGSEIKASVSSERTAADAKAVLAEVKKEIQRAYPTQSSQNIDDAFKMVFHTPEGKLQETLPTGKQLKTLEGYFKTLPPPAPSNAAASSPEGASLSSIAEKTFSGLETLAKLDLTSQGAGQPLRSLSREVEDAISQHDHNYPLNAKTPILRSKLSDLSHILNTMAAQYTSLCGVGPNKANEAYQKLLKAVTKQLQLLHSGNIELANKMDEPIKIYKETALYAREMGEIEGYYKRDQLDSKNIPINERSVHPSNLPRISIYDEKGKLLSQRAYYSALQAKADTLMAELEH